MEEVETRIEKGGRMQKLASVLFRHRLLTGCTPEGLRTALEELGPAYIKLGQFMAARPDILPDEYCRELSKLMGDVRPMAEAELAAVLRRECGGDWQRVFEKFESRPFAAASIAQVHRAVLRTGECVAVKLQRPDSAVDFAEDIRLFKKLAPLSALTPIRHVVDMDMFVSELAAAVDEEMDFRHEAENLHRFSAETSCSCPAVYDELSTRNMLVMEYVDGIRLDRAAACMADDKLISRLIGEYTRQVFFGGIFHGDPHSANILVRDDSLVWIDLGLAGCITERERSFFKRGIKAFIFSDADELANVLLEMCSAPEPPNRGNMLRVIESAMEKLRGQSLKSLNIQELLRQFMSMARENSITMPQNVAVLTRSTAVFAGTLQTVCDSIDPVSILVQVINTIKGDSVE